MEDHFNRIAIRWALIGGIALSAPWLVSHSKSPARNEARGEAALRVGEVLNYRIDWQRYAGAATAQLQIVGRRGFEGGAAWHFRGTVHTAEPIRALYPMDDQIDSYAMPGNFASREYQERLREFGELENTDALLVSPGDRAISSESRVIVPVGTRDALSAIYFLRAADWSDAREIRTPIFDGENIYQMVAKSSASSTIRVAAGTHQATEIEIHLLDGDREVPEESFKLWLATDLARTPLLCEADLSIGKIRIELVSDSAFDRMGKRDRAPLLHRQIPILRRETDAPEFR